MDSLTMVRKLVLFHFLGFFCLYSYCQNIPDAKEIKLEFYKSHRDSLVQYGINKVILPTIEIPALIALSHYPELKSIRIIFIKKSINTTAACRPKWNFLFKSRKNRVYEIYINDDPEKIKGAMLEEIPFDAQIGLIGHELGHVSDYSHKGAFRIIGMGFQYLFFSGKSRIEKRVDAITISHHLGWQLYDFDDFIFNRSKVSQTYKEYKKRVYYKPEELLMLMEKN